MWHAHADSNFELDGTVRAAASATTNYLPLINKVAMGATASTLFGYSASAFSGWSDSITITPPALGAMPEYLNVEWVLDGFLTSNKISGEGSVAHLIVDMTAFNVHTQLIAGSEWLAYEDSRRSFYNVNAGGQFDGGFNGDFFSGVLTFKALVNGSKLDYGWALSVDASGVFAAADFGHTLTQTRILLPNGNTPESEGYTLTFESGIMSPNIVAVPEPTGIILFSLAALIAIAHKNIARDGSKQNRLEQKRCQSRKGVRYLCW